MKRSTLTVELSTQMAVGEEISVHLNEEVSGVQVGDQSGSGLESSAGRRSLCYVA